MNKTIVVFGANCFIGQNLVIQLLAEGNSVISINRTKLKRSIQKQERTMQYDIYSPIENLTAQFLKFQIFHIDALFVLAWDGTQKENLHNAPINMRCANRLYECIIGLDHFFCSHGGKINRLVLTGSQAEYGNLSGIVNELSGTPAHISAYGSAKKYLYQEMIHAKKKGTIHFDAVIELRLHSVYGYPCVKEQFIVTVINKCLCQEAMWFATDCYQKQDYLYISDVVSAFLLCAEENILLNGCYNIGSSRGKTLRDYIEEIRIITKTKAKIIYGNDHNTDTSNFIFDAAKFRDATNWTPKVSFHGGVKKVIDQIENKISC